MPRLSFCNSKTKGHCSKNHSFSEPINMNDRLRTMKENVRKFICVTKTKFLCLGNFHFPAQPTSRFHSIYPEYICCSRISEEALITRYFGTLYWNLLEVSSQFEFSLRRRTNARNVSFFISGLWKFYPHQLVGCQILVFHFLTDATLQFYSKLTIRHAKYGWRAVGSFRCCLLTGNNKQVWTTFLRSSTSSRRLKTLKMSLASMPNSFHLASVFL